jgi:RHS repeat-associated protein
VAEVDSTGNILTRYVYGTHVNVPDYLVRAGITYRLVTDQLGSVREVINTSTGAVVSNLTYDVWGNVTSSTNASFQPFGFAGGLRDDATGLTHFGAREYTPELGRWTMKDPIGFGGGLTNLYGYVGNDPMNSIDLNGLWTASIGVSISFVFAGTSGSFGIGYVVDSHGCIGTYSSFGGGVGVGSGVSGGFEGGISNADGITGLKGISQSSAVGGGDGLSGTVEESSGDGVSSYGGSIGAGYGGGISTGISHTSIAPIN